MEAVIAISKHFNFKNTWVKCLLAICTVLLIITDTLYIARNYMGFGLDNDALRYAVTQFVCHCLLWAIICLWVYCAPRFKQGYENLEYYVYEISGVVKDKPIEGENEEARVLWKKQETWSRVRPYKADGGIVRTVKVLYIVIWIVMMLCSSLILPAIILDHINNDYLGIITVVLAFISISLCMFSWWGCMEFGVFISRVSNLYSIRAEKGKTYREIVDSDNRRSFQLIDNPNLSNSQNEKIDISRYYFNPTRPSQTRALNKMLFASTMTSITFLVVSLFYSALYLVAIMLEGADATNIWEWVWLLLVLVPGILSLFPVVILPKLFLSRMLRRWKSYLVRDYEKNLSEYFYITPDGSKDLDAVRKEREYWTNLIDNVSRDKLDVRYYEIVLPIVTVILNIGIIIATALS